jgi:uncharacterized protein
MRFAYLLIAILLLPAGIGLYTDYLWFVNIGYVSVFLTILKTKIVLWAIGTAIFFIFAYFNVKMALKNSMNKEIQLTGLTLLLVFVFSLFMGLVASAGWEVVLRYSDMVPFDLSDPIFSKDIGFYVFTLPFYLYVKNVLFLGLVGVGLAVFGVYFMSSGGLVRDSEDYGNFRLEIPIFSSKATNHLLLLGGLAFILVAVGYLLDRYSILYSARGAIYGAGYTDVNVDLPVKTLMAVLSVIVAVLFFASIKLKQVKLPAAGVALLFIVSILGGALAGVVQQYKVTPDESNLEKPYIIDNIKYTKEAYGLADLKEVEFPANYNLSFEDIVENSKTIDNIRLWDWRPLRTTYEQKQEIRTYYDFNDVDVDRYDINGSYTQVMLSARELNSNLLTETSWVNTNLAFTHGYGVSMSPVRDVAKEGLPLMYVEDIPPKSPFFNISEPGIYYGELTNEYAIIKTTTKEFDYPKGTENVYGTYEGKGGIELSSIFKRIILAANFGSINILVSNSIKSDSRILFYRNIKERVSIIAPFLIYDSDPYVVLSNGRIYWMIDAYTVTDRYPYSEPYSRINYIRNSVKVVIDAYDGSVDFYVFDENDPIIQTYSNVFKDLFKPGTDMPEDLRLHVRYPEDLFSIQATKYAVYHMNDPGVFYNKEDVWQVPREKYEAQTIDMEPYYLITKLPGEEKEEFIILLPFTPKGKPNMIAWMAARSDSPYYGEKIVYNFQKGELIYGPIQIEARIDQDPDISELFTLWGQGGSKVIRGNLIVIPIENSLLYVEPIYIRAEEAEGSIPELKRVIIAFGDRLAMKETLDDALAAVFNVRTATPAPGVEKQRVETKAATSEELIENAILHYRESQEYLKEGNWTGYGTSLQKLNETLWELRERGVS